MGVYYAFIGYQHFAPMGHLMHFNLSNVAKFSTHLPPWFSLRCKPVPPEEGNFSFTQPAIQGDMNNLRWLSRQLASDLKSIIITVEAPPSTQPFPKNPHLNN
jgi:hypothetical protein